MIIPFNVEIFSEINDRSRLPIDLGYQNSSNNLIKSFALIQSKKAFINPLKIFFEDIINELNLLVDSVKLRIQNYNVAIVNINNQLNNQKLLDQLTILTNDKNSYNNAIFELNKLISDIGTYLPIIEIMYDYTNIISGVTDPLTSKFSENQNLPSIFHKMSVSSAINEFYMKLLIILGDLDDSYAIQFPKSELLIIKKNISYLQTELKLLQETIADYINKNLTDSPEYQLYLTYQTILQDRIDELNNNITTYSDTAISPFNSNSGEDPTTQSSVGGKTTNNPLESLNEVFNSVLSNFIRKILFSLLEQIYNMKEILFGPLYIIKTIPASVRSNMTWVHPMPDYDTIPMNGFFGDRNGEHLGIDFLNPLSSPKPVYAVEDGIVILKETNETYGNVLFIQHKNEFQSRYCQLDRFAVSLNDIVKRGDVIGFCGNTGSAVRYCLHFELRRGNGLLNKDSVAIDPQSVIPNLVKHQHRSIDSSFSNMISTSVSIRSLLSELNIVYYNVKNHEIDAFNSQEIDLKNSGLANISPTPQFSFLINKIGSNQYIQTFLNSVNKPNIFNLGNIITPDKKISKNFVWGDIIGDGMKKLDEWLMPSDEIYTNMKKVVDDILEPLLKYPGSSDVSGTYIGINGNKTKLNILRSWQSENYYNYLQMMGVINDSRNDHIKGLSIDIQVLESDMDDLAVWCQKNLAVRTVVLNNWKPYDRGNKHSFIHLSHSSADLSTLEIFTLKINSGSGKFCT